MNTLQSAQGDQAVQIVGIWGMGGSGKTTLAKELYNKRSSSMDRSSFIFDVRDSAAKGLLHNKQIQLLKGLGVQNETFDSIEQGKAILTRHLRSVRVLFVFDDVDHKDQLDALLPAKDKLREGNLIIVTTREFEVLRSWVFGGQLYGESRKEYWESLLHKISRILSDDIKNILKVSYDALDFEEKEVFLDTACFFIGEENNLAIEIWNGSGWSGLYIWERLRNKCLVELDKENCITMHDHLRDLGREIANQNSLGRVWSAQLIINADKQTKKRNDIRGIMAELKDSFWHYSDKPIVNIYGGVLSLTPSLGGLEIFVIVRDYFNQIFDEISRELIWLRWFEIRQRNLPSKLSLKNLRVLELYENE
ncbi:hypothetical protein SUGI_0251550 [Cryptomeria japonica]|nr:hypothetical protein SUGI_0251550 [Cryptomeria japonica]